jgi:hypothetical protein
MINPLIDNLSHYTDTQLESNIQDLQRKYFLTRNPGLKDQIANILDVYREELYCRRAIADNQQNESSNIDGKDLDSLIKIS